MGDYIDREALGLGKAKREVFDDPKYADGWNAAIDVLQQAPAADVVEVVRCKACEYWETGKYFEPYCNHFGNMMADTLPDDFCSYGKKMDTKQDGWKRSFLNTFLAGKGEVE